jgi:Glycosyl hydrolase family 12
VWHIFAILTAVLMALFVASPAAFAGGGTTTTDLLSGNLGPYYAPNAISNSNGYDTYVANNMWGCGSIQPGKPRAHCGKQHITAWGPSYWWIHSDQAAGNTAVLSYPDVSQLFTDANNNNPAINSFDEIDSSFAIKNPTKGDWEAAYDIWVSGSLPNEIMVWTYNHGQTPAGSVVGHLTSYGQNFTVWATGKSAGDTVSVVLNRNETTGTIHVIDIFRKLSSMGYVNLTKEGLGEIDFGWEICSTGGVFQYFTVTNYNLITSPPDGNGAS